MRRRCGCTRSSGASRGHLVREALRALDSAAAEVMLTGAPLLLDRRAGAESTWSATARWVRWRWYPSKVEQDRRRGAGRQPPASAGRRSSPPTWMPCHDSATTPGWRWTSTGRWLTASRPSCTTTARGSPIEMHDQVVRQLFAVGMGLEGLIESLARRRATRAGSGLRRGVWTKASAASARRSTGWQDD